VVALIVYGFMLDMRMAPLMLTLAPATPALAWSWREYFRQKDAADALEELMKKAQRVWTDALTGTPTASDCLLRSREFQGAIFTRRSSAPSVLPWFYRIKRLSLEDEMHAAAHDFMKQYVEKQCSR
jgi:hypothetical protein